MTIIPVYNHISSRWAQSVELTGVIFNLEFSWNDREQAWYLAILDSAFAPVITGIKLVTNYRLLSQYRATAGMPAGDLLLGDTLGGSTGLRADYDQLGTRFVVVYLEPGE